MAKSRSTDHIDPTWPEPVDGSNSISELAADRQGSLSPFGDLAFPLDAEVLGYEHPTTEINK